MILYAIVFIILLSYYGINHIYHIIKSKGNPDKRQGKILERLSKIIIEDNKERSFNRQNYCEAFADNFARMYGYGGPLMSALNKMAKMSDDRRQSWYKLESERETAIFNMTYSMLSDEHKTSIHRIKSLLDEYQADIDDPNTPPEVKKMLIDDQKEVKLVLNKYLNNMSDFQNKVNRTIAEGLGIIIEDINGDDEESSTDEVQQESVDNIFKSINYSVFEDFCRENVNGQFRVFGHPFFMDVQDFKESGYLFNINSDESFTESKRAREKIQKELDAVTPSERAEFKKKFRTSECSLARDKDGLYVRTHRARSKSYETVDKIPQKDVDFISSTS